MGNLTNVQDLLWRQVDAAEYRAIRKLWMQHSIAEDNADIPGLQATLTEDCVYVMPQVGRRWEGHAGAADFYTGLLTAFPDIEFNMSNIIIGPQGVVEEATAAGTHEAEWVGYTPTGRAVELHVIIFFPWDPERKLFSGERIFIESDEPLRGA